MAINEAAIRADLQSQIALRTTDLRYGYERVAELRRLPEWTWAERLEYVQLRSILQTLANYQRRDRKTLANPSIIRVLCANRQQEVATQERLRNEMAALGESIAEQQERYNSLRGALADLRKTIYAPEPNPRHARERATKALSILVDY